MKRTTILLLFVLPSFAVFAQSQILEANNVSALINPGGNFFKNTQLHTPHYKIPKNSDLSTIYDMEIWMSGHNVNGTKLFIGSDYVPGPISSTENYGSVNYQSLYGSSVWKVGQDEIDYHMANFNNVGYTIPNSIAQWPGNGAINVGVSGVLAPYVDVNENGTYDPSNGDYPEIRGSEVVYTIIHSDEMLEGQKMKVELHLMFYQYSTNNYLNDATFLYVQAFNRSTQNYYDVKQTIYMDFDIGYSSDDYIGCDSASSLLYSYNGDDFDEASSGNLGYGEVPPAQGISCLSHSASSMGYYFNHINGPINPSLYCYYMMRAQYNDTLHWETAQGDPLYYMYNGIPYDTIGVSEPHSGNAPGDRRGIITVDLDYIQAEGSACSDYMLMYARNGITCFNQVNKLIDIANGMQISYDYQVDEPCSSSNHLDLENLEKLQVSVFPNPSSGKFLVKAEELDDYQISVFNLSFQKVFEEHFSGSLNHELQLNVKAGIYLLEIKGSKASVVTKVLIE